MTVQYQIREVFLRKYVERKCNVGFYLGDGHNLIRGTFVGLVIRPHLHIRSHSAESAA